MGALFLRPTKVKHQASERWLYGAWGRRSYGRLSPVDLYERLHRELIHSGVLPASSPSPTNRHHAHVTLTVMRCSWIEDRWVPDEPFAVRLKGLRAVAGLTQEQLAERSSLDVGTVRQLEQGTRTQPLWPTVCALARGLEQDVLAFVGTDGWQPPDGAGRRQANSSDC